MITHLVALSTCAGGPDLQVVEKLLANTAVQRRIIGGFLPGRNPAPGEGGCASGKGLRGDPAARSAAQAERRKLGGSALPRAEGSALSPF